MSAMDRMRDDPDPLNDWGGRLERLNYRIGMMLDDQDFRDEQTFHRASLALVLRHALGMGTLAGLAVAAVGDAAAWRLEVSPGVAIDARGRLMCLDARQSLRLQPWLADQSTEALDAAIDNDVVTADVFMTLSTAELQKTQIFADGPFDATDAVAPARLESRPRLDLLLRPEKGAQLKAAEPVNAWPADAAGQRSAALAERGAFGSEIEEGLFLEHTPKLEASALFLARVGIKVSKTNNVYQIAGPPMIDEGKRPMITLPGKWQGARRP